ncbi:voltage-gated potassium channel [Auricularia subglabra TFB-10046 SS5]|nr:voltage-gated potassium channel [Auricularia subglabra TFB-10046 SS5]
MGIFSVLLPVVLMQRLRSAPPGDEEHPAPVQADGPDEPARPRTQSAALHKTWAGDSSVFPPGRHWWTSVKDFIFQNGPEEGEIVPHYRYLPILSGIVVPFSTLLEIPGLTERWYVRTEGNNVVERRDNPVLLDVGLAISMACGVLANVFLVLRFLEKRPRAMTLLTIIALTIHDIINIIAVAWFGVAHRFNDGFTYGEPFWITLCSTIASTFVNVTLVIDFLATKDFAKSGSGLTRKQRSLLIIIMIFLCWIALGALCNTFINDLDFVSALYFTLCSVETVGFGDIVPRSTGARVFNILYVVVGILNLALAVSVARETIIESFEQSYRRRKHELAERRKEHRKRRMTQLARSEAIERQLRAAGLPTHIQRRNSILSLHRHAELNTNALSEDQLDAALQEATDNARNRLHATSTIELRPMTMSTPSILDVTGATYGGKELQEELSTAGKSWEAQEQAYRDFRVNLAREERKETAAKMIVAWAIFLTFWVLGAVIFWKAEGWGFGIALYFCFITFSTLGYGDYSPKTPAGRAIFVVWALLGVAAMTILISVLSEAYSSKYHSILTNDSFDKALRSFRERTTRDDSASQSPSPAEGVVTLKSIQTTMETISQDLILVARQFHGHLRNFNVASASGGQLPPEAVQKLVEDIVEADEIDETLRHGILQDADASRLLLFLSYERRLRKLINKAEQTIVKLGERSDDIRRTDDMLEYALRRRDASRIEFDESSRA